MLGNITLIRKGVADGQGSKTSSGSGWRSYEYDNLNQLVRENNKTTNETYVYTYDDYGNITSKEIYSLLGTDSEPSEVNPKRTITYTYSTNGDAGWSKLLTGYGEESISYDAIGNPTSYRGATLTWDGRELKSYTKAEVKDESDNVIEPAISATYKYDADGLRSSKTANGETSTYQYVDGQLLYEDRNGNDIYYYYDSYGTPTAIVYCSASGSTNTVYIATNSLGDVIGLYNPSGEMIVKYEYDAWGNVVAETDANGNALTGSAKTWSEINPFRYRGYYYDSETELYYLQSRYYDAEVGRFISTDGQIAGIGGDVLGYNTYAYCQNNPVNLTDESGNWPKWAETAAKVVSVVVAVAAVAVMATTVAGITAGTIVGVAAGKAIFGASVFLGASLSGINGGIANEANGNSYANGYVGGFVSGTTQSVASKYKGGTILGGSLGAGLGTAMTMGLNNLDPDSSNSTLKEIVTVSLNSAIKATFTSSLTALMNSGIGGIDYNTGDFYGGIADQCGGLMPGATLGFGETLKAFFSAVDDAVVYIMG